MKYPLLILALLFTSAPTSAQDEAKCSGIRFEWLTLELETRSIDSEIQEIGSGVDGILFQFWDVVITDLINVRKLRPFTWIPARMNTRTKRQGLGQTVKLSMNFRWK